MRLRALVTLTLCPLLLACPADDGEDDAGADSTGTGGPTVDADMVVAMGNAYATDLVKINDQPFGSAHGLADTVNVYINAEAADAFRALDPEAPSEVSFPEGTLIVKEHLNMEGAYDGFLMMYRGPDGYAPETDNWFWARIDGTGATQQNGASGSVDFCISCHTMDAPSLVYGVSPDNQL